MARPRRSHDLAVRSHPGWRTVRVRLTALYCALFFPAGIVLVVITYFTIVLLGRPNLVKPSLHTSMGNGSTPNHGATPIHVDFNDRVVALSFGQFLFGSCIVLLAMIAGSVLLGWFASGRVLRPLRVITTATRQISERNLHERLALAGPDDELKDLGDTIDGLLARLEAAFESQRRFVANASHELRTPLMLSQTLLQVAMADPAITLDSLRAATQDAIEAGKDQAQLIDSLLTLARSQRGLDDRESVDLTAAVHEALNAHEPLAVARELHIDTALDRAGVSGDSRLIYRLVSNLIDNAIRYNLTGGHVEVTLATNTRGTTLTVANTGPAIPADQVSRLLEPFQRATPDRTANPQGLGLGLSIVSQIAEAHEANLEIQVQQGGGLRIAVAFPAVTATNTAHPPKVAPTPK
jgi:signal transduction histidine kinase